MAHYVVSPQFTDLLVDGDDALVLTRQQLVRVGPIAAVLVEQCAEPTPLDDLAATCRDLFGEPPGGGLAGRVGEQLADLVAAGVLVVTDPQGKAS
ncbi:hypothetical protein ACQB6R_01630 [Propionibacteriaceae bacterium G1746]